MDVKEFTTPIELMKIRITEVLDRLSFFRRLMVCEKYENSQMSEGRFCEGIIVIFDKYVNEFG